MNQSATRLAIIFAIALCAEIFALFFEFSNLRLMTKPLLMPILLVWFWRISKNLGALKNYIVTALIFSWLGDVILLFDKQIKILFIFGLASFLIAHLCYIAYFLKVRKLNSVRFSPKVLATTLLLIYVAGLFSLLAPNLNFLLFPVFFYALALAAMVLSSLHAFDFEKNSFAKVCVAGTLLFVVSDSMLAINRFYQPFDFANIFIMLTYGIAQFLIIYGASENLSETKKVLESRR